MSPICCRLSLAAFTLAVLSLAPAPSPAADAAGLAFRPGGAGYFEFDTGVLRGKVRLDGKSQGITELVHAASGAPVAQGGRLPGIFSYYRVFSSAARYGEAARDWPTVSKVLADGALEVFWPAAADHPLEMTAVYRWSAADTLDLETAVRPQRDMPRFEVFLSSYFAGNMPALVYVKPNMYVKGEPGFVAADDNPLVDGSYLMFPRDRKAVLMIFDGRWEFPPNPVQWSITRYLAAPMAMRRDEKSGLVAIQMAPPGDCFAVSLPYNKTPPDGVAGHQSLYLSLFGQDLKAGETARAAARLVIGQNLTDQQAVELYGKYLEGRKP
jgi:hypothetical protein